MVPTRWAFVVKQSTPVPGQPRCLGLDCGDRAWQSAFHPKIVDGFALNSPTLPRSSCSEDGQLVRKSVEMRLQLTLWLHNKIRECHLLHEVVPGVDSCSRNLLSHDQNSFSGNYLFRPVFPKFLPQIKWCNVKRLRERRDFEAENFADPPRKTPI